MSPGRPSMTSQKPRSNHAPSLKRGSSRQSRILELPRPAYPPAASFFSGAVPKPWTGKGFASTYALSLESGTARSPCTPPSPELYSPCGPTAENPNQARLQCHNEQRVQENKKHPGKHSLSLTFTEFPQFCIPGCSVRPRGGRPGFRTPINLVFLLCRPQN